MLHKDPEKKQRLDQYVQANHEDWSRTTVGKIIRQGGVNVNGKVELKPSYRLKADDKIRIDYEEPPIAQAEDIDLPIIYEDDDCIVIDKPVGVLTHSKGSFNPEATVATWAAPHIQGMSGERAGIVHRLDRATSGVMIIAKNHEALKWLQKQFSLRRTKKTYIAIVKGHPDNDQAIIDMPIERNPKKPQSFRVGANGKSAQTAYKVLSSNDTYSLIELKPTTGRTHQLRVHLSNIGHPIVGDELYGSGRSQRMFLHAKSLEITLPSRERKFFESPLPSEFDEIMV